MVEADMEEIAAFIDAVLRAIGTERQDGVVAETKERVVKFLARFPLPYKL
jgi:glycine/serine hydroxymethyltransferase